MSLTYGFYNSLNGDRKYNALQFGKLFDGIIRDGVFMSIGSCLMVTATEGMGFSVGTGKAWFNHTWTDNDSLLLMELDESELLQDRIDAVVLRIDSTDASRKNSIEIIKGTPSSVTSEVVRPTLTKSEDVNDYPLCYISVSRGAESITQADITNMVGTSECPFVTGILDAIEIDALVAQWESQWTQWKNDAVESYMENQQAAFNTWFETIQTELDGDVAGNLQNQIYNLYDKVEYFGELTVSEAEYKGSLRNKLDDYIQSSQTRNSRKGDLVKIVCQELKKEELWLKHRDELNSLSWVFFANMRLEEPVQFIDSVLYASRWSNKKYSFENLYPFDDYDIEIGLSDQCDREQVDVWNFAKIVGSATTNVLTAVGDVPNINIAIVLKVVKK